jgi:integrase/recombinase XerD
MSEPIIPQTEEPEEITDFVKTYGNLPDKSESTAVRYRTELRRWARHCRDEEIPLLQADENEIKEFIQGLHADLAPKTINNTKAALVEFYEMKGDFDGDTPADLADFGSWSADAKKKDDRDPKMSLEPSEVEKLVENVPAPKLRNRLLIRLMVQTGIRSGEVGTIRVGRNPDWESNDLADIDRVTREIEVLDQKSSKNNTTETREVFYQSTLDELLRIWITTERLGMYGASESEYLFPTRQDETMEHQAVNRVVRSAAESAGIQDTYMEMPDGRERHSVTAHVLRHTFANFAIEGRGESSGMDVHLVQKALGHEDVETTIKKYLDPSKETLRKEWMKHGPSI